MITGLLLPISHTLAKSLDFTDVNEADWFYDSVCEVYDIGIMRGVSSTEFAPGKNMTRAEFVTAFYRLKGSPAVVNDAPFDDLTAHWYIDAVNWAYDNGIVQGKSATTFDPDSFMTRQEMATVLYRSESSEATDSVYYIALDRFADIEDIAAWSKDGCAWVVENGIVTGINQTYEGIYGLCFAPLKNVTRAETATMLVRYLVATNDSLDETETTTARDTSTDTEPPIDTETTVDTDEPVEEPPINYGLPEFVKDKSACVDPAKQYVLPDGYIYRYKRVMSVPSVKYDWVKVESYVTSSWYDEISATVDTVNSLSIADRSNVTSFLLATDIHLRPYKENYNHTESLGKISAEIMRACNIPFFVTAGDNCTQSSEHMPTVFKENMEHVLSQLIPIPQENIMVTVGNHDGATGALEVNGQMVHYRHQLTNEERSSVFFDWQRETNPNKVFDSDGTYFYLDEAETKTRYILLNSYWTKWAGREDGFVEDVEHNFFNRPHFGPKQIEWFANVALEMPEGYGAVIVTHFAPSANDFNVFKGIVDAYNHKTAYTGSYIGARDWQSSSVSVDYSSAKGEIIAVFQGHNHTDQFYEYFATVPCINMTTTGAYWSVKDENAITRVKGTSTEFAVDVVVIDREARKIYLTRLGVGSDRYIEY